MKSFHSSKLISIAHTRRKVVRADRILKRASIRKALRAIVCSLTKDPNLQEDLFQDTLVFLWLLLQEHPRREQWSWYRQRCSFFIKDCLRTGSSVDSLRHRVLIDDVPLEPGCDLREPHDAHPEQDIISVISFHDLITELRKRLDSADLALLPFLAEGHGVREIAQQLGISHVAVIKRRRKIAAVAIEIGLAE